MSPLEVDEKPCKSKQEQCICRRFGHGGKAEVVVAARIGKVGCVGCAVVASDRGKEKAVRAGISKNSVGRAVVEACALGETERGIAAANDVVCC